MGVKPVGISLDEKLIKGGDRLAKHRGLSRSGLFASLLERELEREADGDAVAVVIGGRRYVPEGK